MVPPHGACSQAAMVALRRVGFEAISYTGPRDGDALLGWAPADLRLGGGLPGLHRVTLRCSAEELAFRAFLDQPMCLFGHHGDVAEGLDVLESAVDRVRSVGTAAWTSLMDIARSNYWHRVDGSTLHVRLHTQRALVDVPDGIEQVVMEPSPSQAEPVLRPTATGAVLVHVPIRDAARPADVPSPSWRPWPVARRAASESRDRLQPLLRRNRLQYAR